MKCTFEFWDGGERMSSHTVYKPSFELQYELHGYIFKFVRFLNTTYQHAIYKTD